jgi:hypothetical protein
MLAAFDALQHFKAAVVAEVDLVHALELVGDAEALADELQRDARAARGRLPAAEEQQLGAVEAGNGGDGLGSTAAVECASGKPPMGPSMGTSSKATFWATVIITCCSLALGPSETSQSLLPGFLAARLAAS